MSSGKHMIKVHSQISYSFLLFQHLRGVREIVHLSPVRGPKKGCLKKRYFLLSPKIKISHAKSFNVFLEVFAIFERWIHTMIQNYYLYPPVALCVRRAVAPSVHDPSPWAKKSARPFCRALIVRGQRYRDATHALNSSVSITSSIFAGDLRSSTFAPFSTMY